MGAQPLPFPYIYLRYLGLQTHENTSLLAQPYPSPSSSSPAVLGEALRDCHAPPPPPRCCAAAGWSLPQPLPLSLLDQEGGDVSRPVRVLNAEVPSVRCWSSVIWITSSTTTSSPFF